MERGRAVKVGGEAGSDGDAGKGREGGGGAGGGGGGEATQVMSASQIDIEEEPRGDRSREDDEEDKTEEMDATQDGGGKGEDEEEDKTEEMDEEAKDRLLGVTRKEGAAGVDGEEEDEERTEEMEGKKVGEEGGDEDGDEDNTEEMDEQARDELVVDRISDRGKGDGSRAGDGGSAAGKQMCRYGSSCFQKNPDHHRKFAHPAPAAPQPASATAAAAPSSTSSSTKVTKAGGMTKGASSKGEGMRGSGEKSGSGDGGGGGGGKRKRDDPGPRHQAKGSAVKGKQQDKGAKGTLMMYFNKAIKEDENKETGKGAGDSRNEGDKKEDREGTPPFIKRRRKALDEEDGKDKEIRANEEEKRAGASQTNARDRKQDKGKEKIRYSQEEEEEEENSEEEKERFLLRMQQEEEADENSEKWRWRDDGVKDGEDTEEMDDDELEVLVPGRRKMLRRHSSQNLLDQFLEKIKEQTEETEGRANRSEDEAEEDEEVRIVGIKLAAGSGSSTKQKSRPASLKSMDREEGKGEGESDAEAKYEDDDPLKDCPPRELSPLESPAADLPAGYEDAWNSEHVRMPCSPHNTYRRFRSTNPKRLSMWYLVHTVFLQPIHNSREFQDAVIAYNCTHDSSYAQYWDFAGLHNFFDVLASSQERERFFDSTLPAIIKLALRLPEICPQPIPLLQESIEQEITLTQLQIASLLANAFLCMFPKQGPLNTSSSTAHGSNSSSSSRRGKYPEFTFHNLFLGCGGKCLPNQAAKLRCVIHYFNRVTKEEVGSEQGNVTFRRMVLGDSPDWITSAKTLPPLYVDEVGLIEDDTTALQVDFANKMVGGGVLGYGCIQEEIRFVINTELIVSLLFTARLSDNECLLMTGAERYCKYTGYAKTFRFDGNYEDTTPRYHLDIAARLGNVIRLRDSLGRRQTQIIAMDALYFGTTTRGQIGQYRVDNIQRELDKAYCGFSAVAGSDSATSSASEKLSPVATGNWGCGAFGGYHDLKALLQLMSAAEAGGREVRYYTFGEPGLSEALREVHSFLVDRRVTVGQLYEVLLQVSGELFDGSGKERKRLVEARFEKDLSLLVPQLFNILFEHFEA